MGGCIEGGAQGCGGRRCCCCCCCVGRRACARQGRYKSSPEGCYCLSIHRLGTRAGAGASTPGLPGIVTIQGSTQQLLLGLRGSRLQAGAQRSLLLQLSPVYIRRRRDGAAASEASNQFRSGQARQARAVQPGTQRQCSTHPTSAPPAPPLPEPAAPSGRSPLRQRPAAAGLLLPGLSACPGPLPALRYWHEAHN